MYICRAGRLSSVMRLACTGEHIKHTNDLQTQRDSSFHVYPAEAAEKFSF